MVQNHQVVISHESTDTATGVSKNRGTPKSSILIGFSIINHPFWGTPIFGNIHIDIFFFVLLVLCCVCPINLSSYIYIYTYIWPRIRNYTHWPCEFFLKFSGERVRKTISNGSQPENHRLKRAKW